MAETTEVRSGEAVQSAETDRRAVLVLTRSTADPRAADRTALVEDNGGTVMMITHHARLVVPLLAVLATIGALPAGAQTYYDKTYATPLVLYAAKRSNVRAGPGTSHAKVGLLEVGERVRVTAKTGNWFKLEGQQERFVYAPLLTHSRRGPGTGATRRTGAGTGLVTRTLTYSDGARYHGQTRDGKRHGRGVLTWPSGARYEGDYRNGARHGRGVYTWPNGNRYEGDFVNNSRTGRGVFTWRSGERYEGEFRDGARSGHGVFTWPNGDRYEGPWRDGEPNDSATSTQRTRARECIERLGGNRYRNRCGQTVAFQYCYTESDGTVATCGNPSVKELRGKPEHYYTHLHYAHPGEAFEMPYADRYRYRWTACPSRGDGTFYHAVSTTPGKYTCRFVLFDTTRRKANAATNLARAYAAEREEQEWRQEEAEREQKRERMAAEQRRRNAEIWEGVAETLKTWQRLEASRREESGRRTGTSSGSNRHCPPGAGGCCAHDGQPWHCHGTQ